MAGALVQPLRTGDIVWGNEVSDAEDSSVLPLCSLPDGLSVSGKIHSGGIVCCSVFVDNEKRRELLRSRFGGICAEMESAGVAQVCRRRGAEAAAVKVISDPAVGTAMRSILRAQISVTEALGMWLHSVRRFL